MDIKTGFYKHFKGGYVLVLFTAKHSDRDEVEVVYKGLNNGKYYARPVESFIDIVKDEQGNEVSRFSPATEKEVEALLNTDVNQIYNSFCKE